MTTDPGDGARLRGRRSEPQRTVLWAIVAATVLLCGRLVVLSTQAASRPAHGFVTHYAASRLLLEGEPVERFYDDAWFRAAVQRFEPAVADIWGANPPTVALSALPLALFDYRTARGLWTGASLVLWLGAALWLARVTRLGPTRSALLVATAAAFQPAAEHLAHAQFHIPVLLLVLAAWATLERRPATAGGALGLALTGKAAGLAYWPLLIAQRRRRALLGGAMTIACVAAASLVWSGGGAWGAFFERASALSASGSLSVTAYQSLPGLVQRLTVLDAQWNAAPLLPLAWGRTLAGLVVALALIGAVILATRARQADRAFVAFTTLGLALSPVSLDYHYVIAIFPIAVLFGEWRGRIRDARFALLVLATTLIAADLPYRSPRLADGALALLAYPKLYGALLLTALLLFPPQKPAPAPETGPSAVTGRGTRATPPGRPASRA